MPQFYCIDDNSFYTRGFPWGQSVVNSLPSGPPCDLCGRRNSFLPDTVRLLLEPKKGTKWPDVLGSGTGPSFLLAERILETWRNEGIGEFPRYPIDIVEPYPVKLQGSPPPRYYRLVGSKMRGAELDLYASGYVDVVYCRKCGARSDNIGATHRRQHSVIPYGWKADTWDESHLFTTDLSPEIFFCSSAIANCRERFKPTNVRLLSVDFDQIRQFHIMTDDTFDNKVFPWVREIVGGADSDNRCRTCDRLFGPFEGDLEVELDVRNGSQWPDLLGCRTYPLLIVSERLLKYWDDEWLGEFPQHRVHIRGPFPKKLSGTKPPPYYWLDGSRMQGLQLDFNVDRPMQKGFCEGCGRPVRHSSGVWEWERWSPWPYAIKAETWNGANVFTTYPAGAAYFCTEAVVDCAAKHRFTNFRFTRVEEGHAVGGKGVDYLKKRY